MKQHSVIGFDLDGVLYPFHVALYTELFIHDKISCSFEDFWTATHKYNDLWWDNVCKIEFLYSTQVPRLDILEYLWELNETKRLYYITARPKEVQLVTKQYLRKYNFPQHNNLVFSRNKGIACQTLGVSLMIEDQPRYIKDLNDCGVEVIIHNQLWNKDYTEPLVRINDVLDLRGMIC